MKPIRGEREQEVVHEPWQGTANPIGQSDATHVLSDAGGIESLRTNRRYACDCGCLRPPGGFCAVCGGVVCERCFGFCEQCHMPLCPRHSVFLEEPGGQQRRLCRECGDSRARKRLGTRVARVVLSPFIEFEDSDAPG